MVNVITPKAYPSTSLGQGWKPDPGCFKPAIGDNHLGNFAFAAVSAKLDYQEITKNFSHRTACDRDADKKTAGKVWPRL
ncbi:hypothetical protein [Thalassospira australica]|uniref:hypothetical protein n=1 Tax=Thalassospira australica TaxID=1528106 RepID=UPI00384F5D22